MLHPLLLFLHKSLFSGLIFLVSNHLLHTLSLQFFRPFLNANHFLVLLTLLLKSFCLAVVPFSLAHLLVTDSLFLLHAKILVADHKLAFLLLTLLSQTHLLVERFSVPLSHVNNVVSFLFSFLNFLPGLLFLLLEERDSVGQKLYVFLCSLSGYALVA